MTLALVPFQHHAIMKWTNAPEVFRTWKRGATAIATVRMYRGHWVADYYNAKKRRRIERPEGHFEKATQELQAAQVLLADRVAEVTDGLVREGRGTFEDVATRWLKNKVRIRPSTRRSYEQLVACYLIPYFGNRKLRLIQLTDIERFRTELSEGIPESIKEAFVARLLKARPGLAEARAKQRANQVKLGRRSINKALTVLSMVFNYAMRNQWVVRNPAKYVDHARDERPLEERRLDMDVLTPQEITGHCGRRRDPPSIATVSSSLTTIDC